MLHKFKTTITCTSVLAMEKKRESMILRIRDALEQHLLNSRWGTKVRSVKLQNLLMVEMESFFYSLVQRNYLQQQILIFSDCVCKHRLFSFSLNKVTVFFSVSQEVKTNFQNSVLKMHLLCPQISKEKKKSCPGVLAKGIFIHCIYLKAHGNVYP